MRTVFADTFYGSSLFSVELKLFVHQFVDKNGPAILKGLNHSDQGWPILRGLPWVAASEVHNPERVEYQSLGKQIQPLQGCDSSMLSPRVARFLATLGWKIQSRWDWQNK